LVPGCGKNRVVIAHDVDHRTDDLIRRSAGRMCIYAHPRPPPSAGLSDPSRQS
jgi:hypothetical protein